MKKFAGFEDAKAKMGGDFTPLPKDGYELKILSVKEAANKNGGTRFDIAFDIANGEFKDYFKNLYQDRKQQNEDTKWPNDAIYRLNIPDDASEQWMKDQFKTFVTCLEESNSGYHFDWNEQLWKGKFFGGLFHIEQTEYQGKVYDHTRLKWVTTVDKIREKKFNLPKDKLIEKESETTPDGFVNVPEGIADELPFD